MPRNVAPRGPTRFPGWDKWLYTLLGISTIALCYPGYLVYRLHFGSQAPGVIRFVAGTATLPGHFYTAHFWITSNEILLVEERPVSSALVFRSLFSPGGHTYTIVDVPFGHVGPLIAQLRLNDDGRWIICGDRDGRTIHVMSIDGGVHKKHRAVGSELAWTSDGNRWIEIDTPAGRTMAIRDIRSKNENRLIFEHPFGAGQLDRLPSDRFLFSYFNTSRISTRIQVRELDVKRTRPIFSRTIECPMPGFIREFVPSPTGQRIAWLMQSVPASLNPSLPVRFLNSLIGLAPKNHVSIWISDIDGDNAQSIRTFVLSKSPNAKDVPMNVQWVPGDKQISFLFRNGVFVADTP